MTQSPMELLTEPIVEALRAALAAAWQQGYERGLQDTNEGANL